MAKKKTEDEATPAKKAPAAKKAPVKKAPAAAEAPEAAQKPAGAKKPAKQTKPSTSPMQTPLIDTGLAAQTAAAMIANRGANAAAASTGGSQESSSFKSFKEGLNKPSIAGLGGILGTGGGQKKLGNTFGGKQSTGPGAARNQTFGADVNRAGVPRRTGGG
jgi:hypothetical protein